MNLYTSQDEVRRRDIRIAELEQLIEAMANGQEAVWRELEDARASNDDMARRLLMSLSLNCLMGLVIGWLLL